MRFVSGIFALAFLASCSGRTVVRERFPASEVADVKLSDDEKAVLKAINEVRKSKGLPILVPDVNLQAVAERHSDSMNSKLVMSHSEDGFETFGDRVPPGYLMAGENIGCSASPEMIMSIWLSSETHYANIVGAYTRIGISRRGDGSRINASGCTYRSFWTTFFGSRANE